MTNQLKLIRDTISKRVAGGTFSTYEWDDNMSVACTDPAAELLRLVAVKIPKVFPPEQPAQYTSQKGIEFLRSFLEITREW